MKKRFFGILLVISMLPLSAGAEHTRVTNPSALSLEGLGKGLAYCVQVDEVINDDMAAGFGFGMVGLSNSAGNDTGKNAVLVPAYFHYYFSREQGSFFGEAGISVVTNSGTANGLTSNVGNVKFGSSPFLPTIGLGYEERGDNGFLLRATAYGVIGKEYAPWIGLAFGYAL